MLTTEGEGWAATHYGPVRRRPARSEVRQRTNLVALRFLPSEHAEVSAAALAAGVSLSEFIRDAALGAAKRGRRV